MEFAIEGATIEFDIVVLRDTQLRHSQLLSEPTISALNLAQNICFDSTSCAPLNLFEGKTSTLLSRPLLRQRHAASITIV